MLASNAEQDFIPEIILYLKCFSKTKFHEEDRDSACDTPLDGMASADYTFKVVEL
jgi:hypothetical protein